jgi:hypothetical protein
MVYKMFINVDKGAIAIPVPVTTATNSIIWKS